MGHYASEMSETWGRDDEEIAARYNAGFKPVFGDTYECGRCSAVVVNWRKHLAICAKETK